MNRDKLFNKIVILGIINISVFMFMGNKSYAGLGGLNFNNINIERGISQSTIHVMFQDSKGYIWLGTDDGLNRYNGYEFKIYNYEEDQNSISNNGINDIAEDNQGNIWVSTIQGINKINPNTGKITNYTESNNGIKNDSVSEILITKDKKIVVSTYDGLSIYNEEKDRFDTLLKEENGIISNSINSIDEDSEGNIWIATSLGVNKLSNKFEVLETYSINSDENYIGKSEIYNIYCDDNNNLVWAGSESYGLFKIDTKTKKITSYSYDIKDENSIPSNRIGDIMRDSQGHLWVGTTGGLATYNEENDNFEVYKSKIYDKNSLVYNDVRSLIEDREGVIWVGTYCGISMFDTKITIKNYNAGLDEDYLLSENMVHGIYEDDEGYIWVGTKSSGVDIIDRKNQISRNINSQNYINMTSNSVNDITGYKDLIFIATEEGVVKIDKNAKTIKNYSLEDGIINESVKDILVDDKGYLWIGTKNGLSILNIETDEIIDMRKYISKDFYVRHIYQDSNGNYFLGLLKDEGLCFINTKEKTIKYYKNKKGDKNSISNNRIRYINEDSKGNIWVGTSYGLNKFDSKTEKFSRYTAKDGIPNNTIYGILVDDEDNIWISTNKGISKINIKDKKIKNLSVTDGLQGNEFNGNTSFKSNSGELFFGGTNGLNAFYPKEINKVGEKSKVLFDGFEVNNKEYTTISDVKLNEKTDAIKIKFFTPSYSSNKNIMYEYRLAGTSGGVSTTKDNYVIYNDLPPGNYSFQVRSTDSRGNMSDFNSVDFTIKAPFWRSPISLVIYVMMAVLVILHDKYKVKNLDELVKKRTSKLEEEMDRNVVLLNKNIKLQENKNSYLVNLSHELRTPLNVISSTNQLVLGLVKKNTPIKEANLTHYIDISQRNCNRLLNLVNNIVDSTKLQNDMYVINLKEVDIVYLVEETALTLADYIKSKNIDLIIDPDIEEKIIKCDAYEIERCIVNLIGNAAKFTPNGGRITIGIKDLEDRVMISIIDTGIGIDEKFHKTIFDRFNQVVDVDNEVKGGSGLGLTITNQIVKLHKGDIYVESKLGEGSKFVIILPVDLNL